MGTKGSLSDAVRLLRSQILPAWDQFDRVADLDLAPSNHVAVQRELASELRDDSSQHLGVLHQGVRVKRRHDAPAPKVLHAD